MEQNQGRSPKPGAAL